jgi:hypothetical protein
MKLNPTPIYFPIDKGVYEVALGLRPLGFDFNNPEFDQKIFHITKDYKKYYDNKLLCQSEDPPKYIVSSTPDKLTSERTEGLIQFLIEQFLLEYPEIFSKEDDLLSVLHLNLVINLKNLNSLELLNQLVQLVPEDLVLVNRDTDQMGNSKDYLSYLNVCSPSHWAPNEKLEKNFFDIHEVIPGSERLIQDSNRIIDLMINKGPFVRFIWSFVTDERLNHHPRPPFGYDWDKWRGRSFNKASKIPFSLRIERQVIYGLPHLNSSVFTIGVSFIPGDVVKSNPYYRSQLVSALKSMSKEARVYKGVDQCIIELVDYLTRSEKLF